MKSQNWGQFYKEVGAVPIINATGSVTLLGGSTPLPEVQEAMNTANDAYVPMAHLEEKVGASLAGLFNVPAVFVTSGAGSALTLATASLMAGTDDAKIQQLPDTTGMPNEILLQQRQHYWYDRCMELAGARLISVGNGDTTTEEDLRRAISEKTTAVHYPVFEQNPVDPNILSLEKVIEIAKAAGKPVTVDSAGQIYPLENIGKYVRMGADFQAIAAKYMGAPHSTGFALGTKEMIEGIYYNSFIGYETRFIRGMGRPHKVDRQEIIGAYVAGKLWMSGNHEERLADSETKSRVIITRATQSKGVKAELIDNIIAHQPFGVKVSLTDAAKVSMDGLVSGLKECDPPVWVRALPDKSAMLIHVFGMNPGDAEIVGDSIAKVVG